MSRNKWILFAVICATVLGLLVFVSKKDNVEFTGDPYQIATEGDGKDHVFGSTANKVVMIEYGDFECPGCGKLYPVVNAYKEKYKDDLTFVFRNFPLTNIHPNALAAATAAEAADQQGKFFDMHNKLFENQDAWKTATVDNRGKYFEQYARELGLNVEQFTKDLSSEAVTKKISHDRSTAKKAGVDSTPTFYLNGQKIDQSVWSEPGALEKKIQEAITAATGKKFEDPPDPAHSVE